MHSLKTTTCVGQIFALAKPHDSVGKRTRNRIPKEERKTLVESFIKKHQSLHNGSFPSLSLTHKEVGGSFYTIREIVREIIQENRVLGTSDLVLESKGADHLQDQTLSGSVLMDPVPPLSLSPDGFHSASDQSHDFATKFKETKSAENGEEINGSNQASVEDRGSDILNCREVNGYHLSDDDLGSEGSTQFGASCGEENNTNHDAGLHDVVETVCDSIATKPQDKELEVDNKDRGFEEIPFIESEGTEPVNDEKRVNDSGSAMTEMVNPTKNTAGASDLPAETVVETFPINLSAETVVETFPLRSVTSTMESSDVQPSELAKVCEGEEGTEAKLETDSSTITSVDLGSISDVPEEQGTEVIVGQMPNHISVATENKVEEKILNLASVDVECAATKGTVVANAVIGNGNVHESKGFSNGSLTTEQTIPTSGSESGICKNDIARNEVTSAEKATMEKGKLDASDSSSSQKGNIAPLNRIKPESWKGQSNVAGQETNPILAVLKSFLTAFVKFWSE